MMVIFCIEQTKIDGNCKVRAMSRSLSIAVENTSQNLVNQPFCDEYGERCLYR